MRKVQVRQSKYHQARKHRMLGEEEEAAPHLNHDI